MIPVLTSTAYNEQFSLHLFSLFKWNSSVHKILRIVTANNNLNVYFNRNKYILCRRLNKVKFGHIKLIFNSRSYDAASFHGLKKRMKFLFSLRELLSFHNYLFAHYFGRFNQKVAHIKEYKIG